MYMLYPALTWNQMVVSNIFDFHPYLGKWSNLTNIFQMGWNHQLVESRGAKFENSVNGPTEQVANQENVLNLSTAEDQKP